MENETKHIIATIKNLFNKLSISIRQDLIFNELMPLLNQITVSDFCQLMQATYKKSVTFDIRTDIENNTPIITAIAITPFGEFSAIGENKSAAKFKSVQKAYTFFNTSK